MDTLSAEEPSKQESTIEQNKLTIVIIEAREFIRDCMARALAATANMNIIALASVKEWLGSSNMDSADLVVVSAVGERYREMADINALTQTSKPLPTVILSDDEKVEHIVDALKQGARGYVSTGMPLAVMIEAFRLIHAGGTFVPAGSLVASQKSVENSDGSQKSKDDCGFTPRQADIVEAVRQGKSNKIIAYELNMCESTVKVHVRNIMKRLKAKNRTHVAFLANELLDKRRAL